MSVVILTCPFAISGMIWIAVYKATIGESHRLATDIAFSVFVAVLFTPIAVLAFWLARKEAVGLTHYPIRFNRTTRSVHVFRLDGTVLTVSWDDLFFTLSRERPFVGIQSWDIRGHVLAADRDTVIETFALAHVSTEQEQLRQYWEFVRRYMEEGPGAGSGLVTRFPNVAIAPDTFLFGVQRLMFNLNGAMWVAWLLVPFMLWFAAGRWLTMLWCKLPQWPKSVEAECKVETSDRLAKDARNNPPEMSGWWLASK